MKNLLSASLILMLLKTGVVLSANDSLQFVQQSKSPIGTDSIRLSKADSSVNKNYVVIAGKKVQLGGLIQTRYQYNEQNNVKTNSFDLHRARLDVKGYVLPYIDYRFQMEFAGSPKLLDAYAEIKGNDYCNFIIGQSKIPLSIENLVLTNRLEFIDMAQVVTALAGWSNDVIGNQNGRDIGVQMYGTVFKMNKRSFLDYKIGVYNGAGINVSDNNNSKDVAGRLIMHPVKGLDIAGEYYNGYDTFGSPAKGQVRNREGFDVNYEYENISFRGEYIEGQDATIQRTGFYAQAGYYVIPKLQALVRYDWYNFNISSNKNTGIWYVIGLNYDFNPINRIQLDYSFKTTESSKATTNLLAIQLQLGF